VKQGITPACAGHIMLATILKSSQATETTIAIVETFAKIREFAKVISQLPEVVI